jgi:hypothetical protein
VGGDLDRLAADGAGGQPMLKGPRSFFFGCLRGRCRCWKDKRVLADGDPDPDPDPAGQPEPACDACRLLLMTWGVMR